jgi:hypothetical protein
MAATLRRDLAILPLSEAWATRRLYLCAREFSALTPHADLLAQQLLQGAPFSRSGEEGVAEKKPRSGMAA